MLQVVPEFCGCEHHSLTLTPMGEMFDCQHEQFLDTPANWRGTTRPDGESKSQAELS